MFRITLTANDSYPDQDWENDSIPIQMHLSLEPKFFAELFFPFLESKSNFKFFEKKDDRHIYFISEITECEKLG